METQELVRLTPKKAPFRRAGVHFADLTPIVMAADKLDRKQAILLLNEPLIDIDVSDDGGHAWTRYALPPAKPKRAATDATLNPERAIDPSGPLVPRAPVPTADGEALPPNAADPAVPVARPAPVDGIDEAGEPSIHHAGREHDVGTIAGDHQRHVDPPIATDSEPGPAADAQHAQAHPTRPVRAPRHQG